MTIIEYLSNLQRIKNLAVDRFGNLTTSEQQIFDAAFDWVLDNLDIKRGTPQVDEDLSRAMDNFVNAVVQIINDNVSFQGTVSSFLTDLGKLSDNAKKFHATTNKFDITKAGVTEVEKAVVEEAVNQYSGNGLNANFVTPLRDAIFRNVLAGASMRDIREVLRAYIISGADGSGKLGQYLGLTARQAVDTYTGMINQKLVKEFKFTGYIISGSLIETSSRQCVYAIDHSKAGYLSFKEWQTVLNIARLNSKAQLIPGTTIENLPLNKLHWGCRHEFTPIIKT